MENRIGWLLNRWLLKMDRYPKFGEKVQVETWPSLFKHFYATREFYITDTKDILLGSATSTWIYVNLDKRRPMRIPEQPFNQTYGLDPKRALNDSASKIAEIDNAQSELKFWVRRNDIDTNGHVNNVSYVIWMLEGIQGDISRTCQLSELEVIYKKETLYGAGILSQCQQIDGPSPHYLHRIMDEAQENELARGRTIWQQRQV